MIPNSPGAKTRSKLNQPSDSSLCLGMISQCLNPERMGDRFGSISSSPCGWWDQLDPNSVVRFLLRGEFEEHFGLKVFPGGKAPVPHQIQFANGVIRPQSLRMGKPKRVWINRW